MKKTHPKFQVSLAVTLLICGSFSSTLGIEATKEGTPIDLSAQKLGASAELTRADGAPSIQVTGTAGKQGAIHLFDLEAPTIDSDGYALFGEVRYEGVDGEGFLEMWNHLPAEKGGSDIATSFFSRTTEVSGPSAKLTGDSSWRSFQLPAFINDGSGRRPLKLTLNVVLPGEGTVEIRELNLRTLPTPGLTAFSFFTGVIPFVLVGLSAVMGAIVLGLVWYLKKRKSESELRRIQAFDS